MGGGGREGVKEVRREGQRRKRWEVGEGGGEGEEEEEVRRE